MPRQHYVIFILGLSKQASKSPRRQIPNYWHWLGIDGEIYRLNWMEKTPFEARLKELAARIEELSKEGRAVSLVGVSAGADAAINAYVQKRDLIHKLVLVCGRLGMFDKINPWYFETYPLFQGAIEKVPISLSSLKIEDKQKILTMQPFYDGLVPVASTRIEGVRSKRILSVGHFLSIIIALTVYSRAIARFVKS